MPPVITPPDLPDIELLLLGWLGGQQALPENAAIAASVVRLCTDLPYIKPDAPGAWVRICRVTGATHSRFVDRPVVDIDAYSFSRATAWAVARAIRSLMTWQLSGAPVAGGAVTLVSEVIGPRWIPDLDQDMSRVGASYEIHARP
jgi:hypothetical protein